MDSYAYAFMRIQYIYILYTVYIYIDSFPGSYFGHRLNYKFN